MNMFEYFHISVNSWSVYKYIDMKYFFLIGMSILMRGVLNFRINVFTFITDNQKGKKPSIVPVIFLFVQFHHAIENSQLFSSI